jgi:hypothetical protein
MLGGGAVKQLYDLHGQGRSIRATGKGLGVSRSTVRKNLRWLEVPWPALKYPAVGDRPDRGRTYISGTTRESTAARTCCMRYEPKAIRGGATLRAYINVFRRAA